MNCHINLVWWLSGNWVAAKVFQLYFTISTALEYKPFCCWCPCHGEKWLYHEGPLKCSQLPTAHTWGCYVGYQLWICLWYIKCKLELFMCMCLSICLYVYRKFISYISYYITLCFETKCCQCCMTSVWDNRYEQVPEVNYRNWMTEKFWTKVINAWISMFCIFWHRQPYKSGIYWSQTYEACNGWTFRGLYRIGKQQRWSFYI